MAVVFGVHDADPHRRQWIEERLPVPLSGMRGMRRGDLRAGDLSVHWEVSASTPVSSAADSRAGLRRQAWVVGDPDAPFSPSDEPAQRLLRRATGTAGATTALTGRNGFYLALLADAAPCVALGTDAAGMFPLYYWSQDDVLVFGTSPELFSLHPLFTAQPCDFGIASVLLFGHITGGRSLFRGVRRPQPGHIVEWRPGRAARETPADPITVSEDLFGASYDACVAQVGCGFDDYHRALRPLTAVDLSLSGGQDSRLIAGYAARHLTCGTVRAVSLGRGDDQELRYARRVSRRLGWPHRFRDVEFDRFAEYAAMQIRLESLQGPLASFEAATAGQLLAERGAPFLSGYAGNIAIGDEQIRPSRSPQTGEFGFDALLAALNAYGFAQDVAAGLLEGTGRASALQEVLQASREAWRSIAGHAFQKAWLYQLRNRVRYHVGSIIWRNALFAWPLLPYLDRALLAAASSMPLAYLENRRIQVDLIKREFPRLATLPLDRNAVGADYLVKPMYRKFVPPLAEVSWTLYRALERGRERRYYARIYDFDNPGWRAVRRLVEPHRETAGGILNPAAVNRHLPPPDARLRLPNPVRDGAPTKALLGLLLAGARNFEAPGPGSAGRARRT